MQLMDGPHGLITVMDEQCDFLHPRLHNGVVLQNIQHVTNSICTALYDGVDESDMKVLLMEATKLCAPRIM